MLGSLESHIDLPELGCKPMLHCFPFCEAIEPWGPLAIMLFGMKSFEFSCFQTLWTSLTSVWGSDVLKL